MEKSILHCDMNNFYASVECVLDPSIKDKPVAVCGSEKERHGIVLAKNYFAKDYGIKTGDPIWQAKKKCKDVVIIDNPHFDKYVYYSKKARSIYLRFTDEMEPMGLDECWLDVTNSKRLFGSAKKIADTLRETIKKELGLTISVGVSFNKTFAKLGSDLKKPDATTLITKKNFKDVVWPLPVSYLLGVGRGTLRVLEKNHIRTIGDLAHEKRERLLYLFGKNGVSLYEKANGLEEDEVPKYDELDEVKSISHGITTVKDMENDDDVWKTMLMLTQEIAWKLRKKNLRAGGISISIRDKDLNWQQYRRKLNTTEQSAINIAKVAFELFKEKYDWYKPVRNITVGTMYLVKDEEPQEMTIFDHMQNKEKIEKAEKTMEELNKKYGSEVVKAATLLENNYSPKNRRMIEYNENKN